MIPEKCIWIFSGSAGKFPGGAFDELELAKEWIKKNRLTGVLTAYPLNQGSFDWALENNVHNLKTDKIEIKNKDSDFIGCFSSGSQEHFHCEDGEME